MSTQPLDLVIRWKGREITRLRVAADPDDPGELRRHLLDAMEREHRAGESWIGDYAMDVHAAEDRYPLFTFTSTPERDWGR